MDREKGDGDGRPLDPESIESQSDLSTAKLAQEAVGELAGLERRLPRTLWLAATRPGALTLEHRRGRGANYVSAIRLYAVSSAVYFALNLVPASRGLNLGLVTVSFLFDRPLPGAGQALILVAAVPLFAVFLSSLFGPGRTHFAEYLTFALYFQSALLILLPALAFAGVPDPVDDYLKLAYFVGYVSLGAQRLWGGNPVLTIAKAGVSLILYMVSVLLPVAAVVLVMDQVL